MIDVFEKHKVLMRMRDRALEEFELDSWEEAREMFPHHTTDNKLGELQGR